MDSLALILVLLVALEHVYFAWLEMFAWTSRGPKVFKNYSAKTFQTTKPLAANQGLYNLFLAIGLIWSLQINDPIWAKNVAIFFLACVAVAGFYGSLSIDRKIIFVQSLPALLALASVLIA